MTQRESEAVDEQVEEQAMADSDDTPIIILPDDMDIAAVEPPEAESEKIARIDSEAAIEATPAPPPPAPTRPPAPAVTARKPAPPKPVAAQPAPARPATAPRSHPAPAARTAPGVVRRQAATRRSSQEAEPLFSMADLEGAIDNEITLDRAGERTLFSMPLLCRVVALGAIALLALVLHIGRDYYRLSVVERPLHHFHHLLRPSGTVGLTLGIIGAFVMLLSLAYVARKNMTTNERLGSIQSWMGFHILTGLLGPAIAVFHAAFVPTSALGTLAVTAMCIVVVSGIIGRYIAVYFPRSLEGRELKFEEIRGRLVVYRKKLAELGIDPSVLRIDEPKQKQRGAWLIPSIARVITGDYESRREYRRLKAMVQSRGELKLQTEMVLFLIKKLCWERQWLVRYGEFRRLVGAWRFLHRWLAVVLFVALFFHVVVGLRFGGLWIFGGRK